MRVAIIGGSGKMGRWFADFLLKDGKQVTIIGRSEKRLLEAQKQLGVDISTSTETVRNADVVLISVPIDSFEEVVKRLQPHVKAGQMIIDVTSIKEAPVEMMHRHIRTGTVLGTHPVFGPGATGIRNQNFVLTPTNEDESALAEKVKRYLGKHGARTIMMLPREHDETMAIVLGLSHFIAIISADALVSLDKLKQTETISGTTYRVLLTLAEGAISEDPELYSSLQMTLPGMAEIEEVFLKSSRTWADIVKNRDKQEFINRMSSLKNELEKADPSFRKAYKNMYRLVEEPKERE